MYFWFTVYKYEKNKFNHVKQKSAKYKLSEIYIDILHGINIMYNNNPNILFLEYLIFYLQFENTVSEVT